MPTNDKQMNYRKQILCSIILLFLLSTLTMLRQIVTAGYFSAITNDAFTFTSWAWQFIEALKQGIFYPRWTPLTFWGYGSPTFILYPPLAFYLIAFFNVFTHSIIISMNITKFMSLFLSSMGIFYLIKEFYSPRIALFSASIYILLPYTVFNFYFSGTFASVTSLMWFSPILLFTYRYIKNGQYSYLLYSGVCYGGLILTHLINAYMFSFVICSFVIYMSLVKQRIRFLISIPLIMIIGILVSAAYIFPLVYEKQFLHLNVFIAKGGGFNFSDFFILPDLTGNLPINHFWSVYYREFLLNVLFFCILIIVSFVRIRRMRYIKTMDNINIINKFFLIIAFCSLFFLFGVSIFLWKTIPFFLYVQFPYRWLNITVFAVACLSSTWVFINAGAGTRRAKGERYPVVASLFLILLVCIMFDYRYIRRAHVFSEQELIPIKIVSWSREHLPANVVPDKINKEVGLNKNAVMIIGNGRAGIVKWDSAERIIKIIGEQQLTLKVKTFNFPGWTASIDGVQKHIRTEDGSGAMLIDIPQGEHILELNFVDTPIRCYSKYISLFSIFVIAFLLSVLRKDKIDRLHNRIKWISRP